MPNDPVGDYDIHITRIENSNLTAIEYKELTDWPAPVIEQVLDITASINKLTRVLDQFHRVRAYFYGSLSGDF